MRGAPGGVRAKYDTCQRSTPLRKTSRVERGYSRRSRRTFSTASAVAPTRAAVSRRPGGGTSGRGGLTSAFGLTGVPGSAVGNPPELPGAAGACAAAGPAAAHAQDQQADQQRGARRAAHRRGHYALKLQSLLPMKFSGVAVAIASACAGTAATPRPSTSV